VPKRSPADAGLRLLQWLRYFWNYWIAPVVVMEKRVVPAEKSSRVSDRIVI
jgi:hypothetical protein